MVDKIIWQPEFIFEHDFKVLLNRDFAKEMIKAKMPDGMERRMNQLANEKLKELGVHWLNPYTFHGDSCFLSQIYLGQNGLWLSTSYRDIEDLGRDNIPSKPVEYYTHNVDMLSQAYHLMRMFDMWIHYSDVLKE